MKKHIRLLFLCLLLLAFSFPVQAASHYKVTVKKGRITCTFGGKMCKGQYLSMIKKGKGYKVVRPLTEGSRVYYFAKNGSGRVAARTGVTMVVYGKFKGNYYLDNGTILKNQIVRTKNGFRYVDPDGIITNDTQIQQAVNFVMKSSTANAPNETRLYQCFRAMCRYSYRHMSESIPGAGVIPSYASTIFTYHYGNCYRFASGMTYIARVLGYDSRLAAGGVTAYAYRNLSAHGWCEVFDGSVWKMIDCTMQRAHPEVSLFMKTSAQYPFRHACYARRSMSVRNGRVYWK